MNRIKNPETAKDSLELLLNISRELNSSLDLHEVLQRVVLLSMKSVGAINGSLIVLDEQGRPVDSVIITGEKVHENVTGQLATTLENGLAGWAARNRLAVLVPDTSRDERWLRRPDDALDRTGPKSAVSAPVLAHEQLVGVLTLVHPRPGFFQPKHLALVQIIAGGAGTAIRHAELFEQLRSAHQRFRDLFEDSLNPILVTDWNGTILEANRQAERLTRFDRGMLLTIRLEQLGILRPAILGVEFGNLASDSTIAYEALLACAGERAIPVQIHARRVLIQGIPYIQWILTDITLQKDLDRLREDLFSMVYHDLRSPLSNILSSLNMIEGLLPGGDSNVQGLLQIASRSALRIQRLTNSLLDIQRLETGQPVGRRQPVLIAPLLQEAAGSLNYATEGRDQEICICLGPDLAEVNVDPDMILRVFLNLLENALKFSPQGSKILLNAQRIGDFLEIGVQDCGPGIPEQDHERIFEKFTRLQTPEGTKGLGLGLAFCRLAVEGHGGRIWVVNEPQGGAHFKLTLPVWQGGEPSKK